MLSIGSLSQHFKVNFTYDPHARSEVSTSVLKSRRDSEGVLELEIENGLYSFTHPSTFSSDKNQVACSRRFSSCKQSRLGDHVSRATNDITLWHQKLAHASAEQLFETSSRFDSISKLTLSTIKTLFCTDSMTAKCKRTPIQLRNRKNCLPSSACSYGHVSSDDNNINRKSQLHTWCYRWLYSVRKRIHFIWAGVGLWSNVRIHG